jgi:hypothetical protein
MIKDTIAILINQEIDSIVVFLQILSYFLKRWGIYENQHILIRDCLFS